MDSHEDIDEAEAVGFAATGVDLDDVIAGQTFQATWGFKNIGKTTWDSDYKFVYRGKPHSATANDPHSLMATFNAFTLGELGVTAVSPNNTIHLTLSLTAPATAVAHATTWQLQTPDGRFFGPLRWLRAVVTTQSNESSAVATPEADTAFEPDSWRTAIWAITSVFESGLPGGRIDAYQNEDAGIVSYGKHQATLQSGNLERVLTAFFQRSGSAASQALQHEFAERVQQKDISLRQDVRFKQLLLEAAQEDAMSQAQDELFAQNFYQPVVGKAQSLRVKSALGLACLYDTRVQGGLDAVVTAVSQKLGVQKVGEQGIDEPTWLRTFLDEREARLNRLADLRAAENRPADAQALRTSTFRVAELRRLLEDGNLALAGEFLVRGQLIRGHVRGREKAEPIKPTKPKPVAEPVIVPERYSGPSVKFAAGLHGPGDAHTWHDAGFRNMLKKLDMPIKFMSDGDRYRWYAEFHKPHLNLVRVFWKPDPNRRKSARQAWDEDIRDGVLNFYKAGARHFEVHNEPRLHHEGMGHQWHDGAQFGTFLRELMLIIKEQCPEANLWYPGESPGVPWTAQFDFIRPAYKQVSDLCYGICQHAYSGNTTVVDTAVAEIVDQVKAFHKALGAWRKPIIVSECSVNRAASPEFRAKVYTKAAHKMSRIPGVQGVFWYISHWNAPPNEQANAEGWYGTDLPDRYKRMNAE